MILRPVKAAVALRAADDEAAGGLTRYLMSRLDQLLGKDRR